MSQWFTVHQNKVLGPYSTDQVRLMVNNGSVSAEHRIWGALAERWMKSTIWIREVEKLESRVKAERNVQLWYYAINTETTGPLEKSEMIRHLKEKRNSQKEIRVWTKGMKSWASLFEFYDIMDEIGISRRQYPRSPIEGRVIARWEDQTAIGTMQAIGEGGFGVNGLIGVQPGQVISVELQCPQLIETIRVKAEVRSTGDNFTGCRFVSISPEQKSLIIQYVRNSMATQTRAAA